MVLATIVLSVHRTVPGAWWDSVLRLNEGTNVPENPLSLVDAFLGILSFLSFSHSTNLTCLLHARCGAKC